MPTSGKPIIKPTEQLLACPSGLGDYDDILMLTVRNEHEPFVGRMPPTCNGNNARFDVIQPTGAYDTIESPLAEVVWFAIENPAEATTTATNRFFGEPGMRTIYRRTLLIAPWVNPYREIADANTGMFSRRRRQLQGRARPGAAAAGQTISVDDEAIAGASSRFRIATICRSAWNGTTTIAALEDHGQHAGRSDEARESVRAFWVFVPGTGSCIRDAIFPYAAGFDRAAVTQGTQRCRVR